MNWQIKVGWFQWNICPKLGVMLNIDHVRRWFPINFLQVLTIMICRILWLNNQLPKIQWIKVERILFWWTKVDLVFKKPVARKNLIILSKREKNTKLNELNQMKNLKNQSQNLSYLTTPQDTRSDPQNQSKARYKHWKAQ